MSLWHLSFAINPLQTTLVRWFQSLADSYPALSWMVAHPLLAVISLLVVLAIIQILLGWISSGIKHLLFTIVKSPYSFVRWLLGKTTAPLSNPKRHKVSKYQTSAQVSALLKRLDQHHREQGKLIQELKTLTHKGDAFTAEVVSEASTSESSTSESQTTPSKISSS